MLLAPTEDGHCVAQPAMDDGHARAQPYSYALDRLPKAGGSAQESSKDTWERLVMNIAQETSSSAGSKS